MPPKASAIAPTADTAAMSAPVKARPEPDPPVKARPELALQVAATLIVVEDESPEAPVATIVYEAPGVALDGIVTAVENELVEVIVVMPNVAPLSVNVTDSFGSKLVPATVTDPPGTEHPELAVIPIAFGS